MLQCMNFKQEMYHHHQITYIMLFQIYMNLKLSPDITHVPIL